MKDKKQTQQEKLPIIYPQVNYNNNNQNIKNNDAISRRNEIIDEYILNMDNKSNGMNEISMTSEEDEKDPFSAKAIKNLKPIKKNNNNKLILPNFAQREKLKSEQSKRLSKSKFNEKFIYDYNNKQEIECISNTKTCSKNNDKKNKNNFFDTKKCASNPNYEVPNILNKKEESNNNSKSNSLNICPNNNNKWENSATKYYNNYLKSFRGNKILKNNFTITNNIKNNSNKNNNKNNYYPARSKSHIGQKTTNENNFNYINAKRKTNSPTVRMGKTYGSMVKIKNMRRNFTAKNFKIKTHDENIIKKNNKGRVFSTMNTRKILENKHQIYEKLLKEKNNPYGIDWINKLLQKNTGGQIGITKGFVNGVPIIKLMNKGDISKKELKKKLSELEKQKKNEFKKLKEVEPICDDKDLEDEYNIPKEILDQFNKNTKNFFKFRKDIIEQPEDEEEEQTLENQ